MLPLSGYVVLDLSRMLPGAVLGRTLADLGARIIKVEDPHGGDPMRHFPPLVDGIGAGFREYCAGAESVGLDLKSAAGQGVLRRLARHVDVLVESFRPGKMAEWGLGLETLREQNPVLVTCSLSGFGSDPAGTAKVGHDLNILAGSGMLTMLPGLGVPRVQLADVATGLLAGTSVLAALLQRQRTGRGMHIEQSIAASCLPFMAWAWADGRAGGGGMSETLISGKAPSYRLYRCADDRWLALAALEPKFWVSLLETMGLSAYAGDGLEVGAKGEEVAARLAEVFATQPAQYWLDVAADRGLPLDLVQEPMAAASFSGATRDAGTPILAAWSRRMPAVAPRLGQHTTVVLQEMGVSALELAQLARDGSVRGQ